MNSPINLRHLMGWSFLLGGLMLGKAQGEETSVLMTARVPIQQVDTTGHPSAVVMSTIGSSFSLVRVDGDKLVLKDPNGNQFLVSGSATNYFPPAAAVVAVPPETNASPAVPISSTVADIASSPAHPSPSASTTVPATASTVTPNREPGSPEDQEMITKLNGVLGIPLVKDTHFWDDSVEEIGQRLRWPLESQTSTESSFRRYAFPQGTPIIGAQAYSLALYGKNGKPTYLSFVFSNAGDFAESSTLDRRKSSPAEFEKVRKDLAIAVKQDAATIDDKLTAFLGPSAVTLYGNSASNRDEVHRWDWKDISLLLNSHGGEYASLKIIPSDAADHYGTVAVKDESVLKEEVAKRVSRRDNGDVVLTDLPMVDQGPKGYCVPATWERYLRYMDVPADLYVLAILGDTGLGGGTNIAAIREGVDDYVGAYHRRIELVNDSLDVGHVAKYIDQGLPLMWTCFCSQLTEREINIHSQKRVKIEDWTTYKTEAARDDEEREKKEPVVRNEIKPNGHMRMIIGYNTATDEIAISDSWGAQSAERWMTIKEANDITAGDLEYIRW